MVWQVIVCALSACGILLIVWCAVGKLLLPVRRDVVSVYMMTDDASRLEKTIRAHEWLCQSGLLEGTLVVVDDGSDEALTATALELCDRASYVRLGTKETVQRLLKLER